MQENNRVQMLESTTGMVCTQNNGQRLLCLPEGPFEQWEYGCEIFFSNFPYHEMEDALFEIFKEHGKIKQIRLMMCYDGQNKGFGFILFSCPEEATRAVNKENGRPLHYFSQTWVLKVCLSRDNRRLFLGRIPKTMSKTQLSGVIRGLTEGFQKAFLYKDWDCHSLNRGFCFLEFDSHRQATKAKITLTRCLPERLNTNEIIVNWAIPEPLIDKRIMDKVKKVFIRGLRLETSSEHIRKVVSDAIGKKIPIYDIRKTRDYAFVYFPSRKATMTAMKQLDGTVIDGAEVEILLARPLRCLKKWEKTNIGTSCTKLNSPLTFHAPNQPNSFLSNNFTYSNILIDPSVYNPMYPTTEPPIIDSPGYGFLSNNIRYISSEHSVDPSDYVGSHILPYELVGPYPSDIIYYQDPIQNIMMHHINCPPPQSQQQNTMLCNGQILCVSVNGCCYFMRTCQ